VGNVMGNNFFHNVDFYAFYHYTHAVISDYSGNVNSMTHV